MHYLPTISPKHMMLYDRTEHCVRKKLPKAEGTFQDGSLSYSLSIIIVAFSFIVTEAYYSTLYRFRCTILAYVTYCLLQGTEVWIDLG